MTATKCMALLLLAMAVGGSHAQGVPTKVSIDPNIMAKFDADLGTSYAAQTLDTASQFVWKTFGQQWPTDTKDVKEIDLNVESNVNGISYVENNVIYLSSDYISSYQGDLKQEVTGYLYHGVADIWQCDANGAAPVWWRGGVSNYVRLTAGLFPSDWATPGSGDSWARGSDIAARFFQYLDTVTPGFVALLNAKMKTSWDIRYFKDITGKSVDDLWKDYKAKYGNIP